MPQARLAGKNSRVQAVSPASMQAAYDEKKVDDSAPVDQQNRKAGLGFPIRMLSQLDPMVRLAS
ncbi:hypothetical protein N5D83_10140 [Pseudomonas chengduensis]|nr:hypothetical protein [Pseudomonas chengduensis]MDH1867164.1 hypothetical protein [Pseudomonas chengduensis]